MSWITNKAEIVASLSGYNEIGGNREPIDEVSTSELHKGYSLKWLGFGESELNSGGIAYSHRVELRIGYQTQPASTRDANALLFENLIGSISQKANFKNILEEPTFEDIDSTRQEAVFTFLYGSETQ